MFPERLVVQVSRRGEKFSSSLCKISAAVIYRRHNFMHRLAIWSHNLVTSVPSLTKHGQGAMYYVYVKDLENIAATSRRHSDNIRNSTVIGWFSASTQKWKFSTTSLLSALVPYTLLLNNTPITYGWFVQALSYFLTRYWQLVRVQQAGRINSGIARNVNWGGSPP